MYRVITANSGLLVGSLAYACGCLMVGSPNDPPLFDDNAPTQSQTLHISSRAFKTDSTVCAIAFDSMAELVGFGNENAMHVTWLPKPPSSTVSTAVISQTSAAEFWRSN